MIMITGGSYQGKTEFVRKQYGLADSDIVDGCNDIEMLRTAVCIKNFERFVFSHMESYTEDIEMITENNPDVIIIIGEIGSGIIPLERAERKKREAAGKAGCLLARKAETVIRVICGIPCILKGKSI